jgi:hypothetical protein
MYTFLDVVSWKFDPGPSIGTLELGQGYLMFVGIVQIDACPIGNMPLQIKKFYKDK